MKHLKTYKKFECNQLEKTLIDKKFEQFVNDKDIEYIEKTIKHILYPLSDIGYTIFTKPGYVTNFDSSLSLSEFVIRVVTYADKQLVITDDIKYEFDTMVDYLKSEGFNSIYVHYVKEPVTSQIMLDYDSFIESLYQWGRPAPLLMDNGLNKVRNLLFVAKK